MTREEIGKLSYRGIAKALDAGSLSIKELKKYYTEFRDIAEKRAKRMEQDRKKLEKQYGDLEIEHFRKLKNIITTSDLVKEFSSLTKYVNKQTSSITGLKKRRKDLINYWKDNGFPYINESNYGDFRTFMKWFKSTNWSIIYDSDDTIVEDVFNSKEASGPEDWERLMKEFSEAYENQKSNNREHR